MEVKKLDCHYTPSQDTFIASSPLTVYDLLKSEACRGKHIHCSFSVEEFAIDVSTLERELRTLNIKSIGFQGDKVLILDQG